MSMTGNTIERLERELTAAKAEIAYVREESATHEHFKGEAYKIADTWKARAERAESELRERTQWQCKCGGTDCAGMAENERLKAEVAAFKANNRYMRGHTAGYAEARDEYGEQLKPLFAKVRELEADNARLIDALRQAYNDLLTWCRGNGWFKHPTVNKIAAILEAYAARGGKGAT